MLCLPPYHSCRYLRRIVFGLTLVLGASAQAWGADSSEVTVDKGQVTVDVGFDKGEWVSECTDFRDPQSCAVLAYKAEYHLPTQGDKAIPFELRLILTDLDSQSYAVVVENRFLQEGAGENAFLDRASVQGLANPDRLVLWRRRAECSLRGANAALPDGGIYCDFTPVLVDLAADAFAGLQSGDGSGLSGGQNLRLEIVDSAGRRTRLDFTVPLEGLKALLEGGADK